MNNVLITAKFPILVIQVCSGCIVKSLLGGSGESRTLTNKPKTSRKRRFVHLLNRVKVLAFSRLHVNFRDS